MDVKLMTENIKESAIENSEDWTTPPSPHATHTSTGGRANNRMQYEAETCNGLLRKKKKYHTPNFG